MLNIYKTVDCRITKLEQLEDGCWISVIQPTPEEISYLVNDLKIEPNFIRSALDEEETSHIEIEEDHTLIVIDAPVAERQTETDDAIVYSTMPIGVILTGSCVITVALREHPVFQEILDGIIKNVQTSQKTRFFLILLLRVAARFLQCLKQIDKISSQTEKQLHKSMRNKELIQLLGLEKSLVYFSTSLKADEVTVEKILRGRILKMYEEDQDLLEDVLIEMKQAVEMCNIYSGILSGTMDAFASIISNNLNIVMKVLTAITICMTIPTMVFSFYGMNVSFLPMANSWFPLTFSAVITGIVAVILVKKGMFR